jgi:hypothetical protein
VRAALALVAVAAFALAVFAVARHRQARPARPALAVVRVPRGAAPKIDGDLDEPTWRESARRVFVRQDGAEGRPYSDIRVVRSGAMLDVALYASDHDIVTAHVPPDGPVWRADAFHVVFTRGETEYAFDVDPACTITDGRREGPGAFHYAWQSGARAACDADGTIDHPGDNDEEWVVEMQIPLAALGLRGEPGERLELAARRCDVKTAGGKPLETPCPRIEPVELVFD